MQEIKGLRPFPLHPQIPAEPASASTPPPIADSTAT